MVGTVNVFEAARKLGIKRISLRQLDRRARRAWTRPRRAMHTLYGAYKHCDEQIAQVYSQRLGRAQRRHAARAWSTASDATRA